ncbi:MAG: histidine ammonia-lyase [Elusimicrobia bacterium CG08_land_8_20_14_0_20_51_18]|nr:MAG: histidine ammonia-lyase [Elusimicrobia bacterium CG08_land_8_20_14_0_20_51_18]
MKEFCLGEGFSVEELSLIMSGCRTKFRLSGADEKKLAASRKALEKLLKSGRIIYGINTGFGQLASEIISPEKLDRLQLNLIRSHSCGVGEPLSDEEARALVFIRANELARCHSGVRPVVVKTMCELLNKKIVPYIPEKGSVGASGDLAPSAHMALVLIGEGKAKFAGGGKWEPSARILKKAGIKPLELKEKEGLALINGTQAMQAIGGLSLYGSLCVFRAALETGALTLEALKGTPVAFDERIHMLKPHPGQLYVAEKLREIAVGSEIRESHRLDDNRVQDPYSLRCMPQVMGPVRDNLEYCSEVLEREFMSVTDNPLVFTGRNGEMETLSGGNFHGQALSFAFDFAGLSMTALGNMSERRIAQLIGDFKILPPFLAKNPGLESGFMIAHVTAAALCNENKTLAHPSSADSIPTSANKEDFVSMGTNAALKLRKINENAARIVAIELMAAAAGIEYHRPLKTSKKLEALIARLYKVSPKIEGDVEFSERIENVAKALLKGGII